MLLCLILLVIHPPRRTSQDIEVSNGHSCQTYGHMGPRELALLPQGVCTDIRGNVWFLSDEVEFDEVKAVFSTVKNIYGCVSIRNTRFSDLGFFSNLENVECAQNQVQAVAFNESFVVTNNPNLKSLGLLSISNISGPTGTIHYANGNHPTFCMDDNEKAVVGSGAIDYVRRCSEPVDCFVLPSNKTDGSQLPQSCTIITWNILLRGNVKQEYIDRLKSIEVLVGTLTVKNNTDIELLDISSLQLIRTSITAPGKEATPSLKKIMVNGNLTIEGSCKSVKVDRISSQDLAFTPPRAAPSEERCNDNAD